MVQQDSLVLVDVAWDQLSIPYQCLVTWEVSGGGLMGNLLTETFSVQLSLWPDTKYRVQVTCKNKVTIKLIDVQRFVFISIISVFISIISVIKHFRN